MNDEKKLSIEEWAKRNREEHEKWENSYEGIRYNLNIMPEVYDEKFEAIIIKTLQKIPKDIRTTILEDKRAIFFIMQGYGVATTLRFRECFRKEEFEKIGNIVSVDFVAPLIVLNGEVLMEELERGENDVAGIMSIVAHEIAHVILEQKTSTTKDGPTLLYENEVGADDLIEKWGFKRAYKSYEKFKSLIEVHKTSRKYL